jgi:hypothetical protein
MLEFVLVYFLAGRVGRIVEAKGQRGSGYKWLTVGLWFGGEILGFLVGFSVTGRHGTVLEAYPFAIGGALAGAAIAWFLATQVAVVPGAQWTPTHMTPPAGLMAWAQPNPALPPMATIPGQVAVAIESRQGDWAYVRAANGWGGFVDARALESGPEGAGWAGQQPQR